MEMAIEHVSQAAFAAMMNVSRARVTQWKNENILTEQAFAGAGKTGKLILHVAQEQVRSNRNVGQSLGNGLKTNVQTFVPREISQGKDAKPEKKPTSGPERAQTEPEQEQIVSVEEQLRQAKLEEQLRRNRNQAIEEAKMQALLMEATDVKEQMNRVASTMLQIFEAALPDFASAIASQLNVPQRDALHTLRAEFTKVRKTASSKHRLEAESAPKTRTVKLEIND